MYNMHLENKWVEFSLNVDFNFSETWSSFINEWKFSMLKYDISSV